MHPRELPIYAIERDLVSRARAVRRFVVRAPTGSGKSTQIPQMILDHGLAGEGSVVVLQPRRIAARMLAARVARERRAELGGEVGYQVRFEQCGGAATRIRYVTEGILVRQMIGHPDLRGVGCVLFDEFHERHLYGDLSLARALMLQGSARPDLLIGVMSATLGVEPLERYLDPCAVLVSEGRTFPVDVAYLDRAPGEREGVWDLAVRAFERLADDGLAGDVLVFMPGAYEIQRTLSALRDCPAARGYARLPLHGELPPDQQDLAVAPSDRPRIVVATNVAETSLTIEGVRAVIDGGLARIPRYDPYRGINTLLIERISRASADQRAGRAGRTAPGRCVRLWTERDHAARAPEETPEIRRIDLAEAVLTLKASGVPDLRAFRWLEPPSERTLARAEALLADLGATDEAGTVTALGRRMIAFPLHPRYARMLVEAGARGAVRPVALIAALTQGRGLLVRRQGREVRDQRDDLLGERAESDFFRLMRAWTYADRCGYDLEACRRLGIHAQAARQVKPLFDMFLRLARAEGLPIPDTAPTDDAIGRCVLAGFVDHLARRLDAGSLRCQLVHGRKGRLDDESAVRHAPLFVAAEVREIEGRNLEVVLSLATAVQDEWLREMFPDAFREEVAVRYERGEKRVVAEAQVLFHDLPLASRRCDPPAEAAARLLADEVEKGELKLKHWDEAVEYWIARVNFLAREAPDFGVPAIGPADRRLMIEQLCLGAGSHKDIKERPVMPLVRGWLNAAQQAVIERHAPERIEMSNGRRARVHYPAEGPPHIAMRVQDLYGVTALPRLAGGRVRPVAQVLGPNFRPVQVTADLEGFWRDTYPKVRQELRRKYPKHEWR